MRIDEFLDKVNSDQEGDATTQAQNTKVEQPQKNNTNIKETKTDSSKNVEQSTNTSTQKQTDSLIEKKSRLRTTNESDDVSEEASSKYSASNGASESPVEQKNEQSKVNLGTLLVDFEQAIQKKDANAAMKTYAHLKQSSYLITELSEQERKIFYQRIVTADEKLTVLVQETEQLAQQCVKKIADLLGSIHNQNYQQSLASYQAARQWLETIPESAQNFKEEAKALTLQIYTRLIEQKSKSDQKTVLDIHSKIMDNIVHARHYMHDRDYTSARHIYHDALELYQHLPAGFMKEKAMLYKTIIALFNDICLSERVQTLQQMMGSQEVQENTDAQNKSNIIPSNSSVTSKATTVAASQVKPNNNVKTVNEATPQINSIQNNSEKSMLNGYILRAKNAVREGNYAVAQADIQKVLAIEPENEHALKIKKLLEQRKQPANSSSTPQNLLDAKINRIVFQANHGEYDKAQSESQKLFAQYPNEPKIQDLQKRLKSMKASQ